MARTVLQGRHPHIDGKMGLVIDKLETFYTKDNDTILKNF